MHTLNEGSNEHRPIQLIEIIASDRFGVVCGAKFKHKGAAVNVVQKKNRGKRNKEFSLYACNALLNENNEKIVCACGDAELFSPQPQCMYDVLYCASHCIPDAVKIFRAYT